MPQIVRPMPELCKRFVRNMLEIYSAFETQVMLATCQNSEMNYVRNLLEICPNCSRILLELCFKYAIHQSDLVQNIYKDSARNMLEFMMQYASNLPDLCYNYARNPPDICQNCAWIMLELCQNRSRNMPELFQKSVRHMSDLCKSYAMIMHKSARIIQKCAINLLDECQNYAWSMPESCQPSASWLVTG